MSRPGATQVVKINSGPSSLTKRAPTATNASTATNATPATRPANSGTLPTSPAPIDSNLPTFTATTATTASNKLSISINNHSTDLKRTTRTKPRSPPLSTVIKGGSLEDCLSSRDIDGLVAALLPENYLHATFLYDIRTGRKQATSGLRTIVARATRYKFVLAPLHVRHHWCTALFTHTGGKTEMHILDSAPSATTQRDIDTLSRRLGVRLSGIRAPLVQPPHSNQCGLFVLLYACMCALGAADDLVAITNRSKGPTVDLAQWRETLKAKLEIGLTPDDAREHLRTIPTRAWPLLDRLSLARIPQSTERLADQPKPPVSAPLPPLPPPLLHSQVDTGTILPRPPSTATPPTKVSLRKNDPYAPLEFKTGPARKFPRERPAKSAPPPTPPPQTAVVVPAPQPPPQRRTPPPAYDSRHLPAHQLAGGAAEPVPRGLPNPPGDNVCFANALAQALGDPAIAPVIITLSRAQKMNTLLPNTFVRRQEDPAEVLGLFGEKLGLPDEVYLQLDTKCLAGHVKTAFQSARFVSEPPGLSFSSPTDDAYCEVCNARGPASTTMKIVSGGSRLIFALGRARCGGRVTRKSFNPPATFRIDATDYELRALVIWQGHNADAGHYFTYRRSGLKEPWILFNDESVTISQPHRSTILTSAVIAVYERPSATATKPTPPKPAFDLPPPMPRKFPPPPRAPPKAPVKIPLKVPPPVVAANPPLPPPAPKAPKPTYLTYGAVRRILGSLQIDSVLKVHWTFGDDAGVWAGTISEAGPAVIVTYTRKQCELCSKWHRIDPTVLELPYPQALYYSVDCLPKLPSCSPHCDPDADEVDEADDEQLLQPTSTKTNDEQRHALFSAERNLLKAPSTATTTLTGRCGRGWFIYPAKPDTDSDHVHSLVWRQLSSSTRRQHVVWIWRIKSMPQDLENVDLGTAVVELVLRLAAQRGWKWSTISGNLSAANSALRALPIYTNCRHGIDLSLDPVYRAAMKNAQRLARLDATDDRLTKPLTEDQYKAVSRSITIPQTKLFADLLWCFASRPADLRHICREHVVLGLPGRDAEQKTHCALTFTKGKGAAWWGPYTIHVFLPLPIAKALTALQSLAKPNTPLFSVHDQARVAAAVKSVPGCSLRSFRRGALLALAAKGVKDSDLILLSGHQKAETLGRYLGWNRYSTTAKKAALKRAQAESRKTAAAPSSSSSDRDSSSPSSSSDSDSSSAPSSGSGDNSNPSGAGPEEQQNEQPARILPPKMGMRSGFCGIRGRRVPPPPPLFPLKAPSSADLGISSVEKMDTSSWPLHVKRVTNISWPTLEEMAASTPIRHHLLAAKAFIDSSEKYGVDWAPVAKKTIPLTKFSPPQLRLLEEYGKIVRFPDDEPIRSFAVGWTVPEEAKKRHRPIIEPYLNCSLNIDAAPPLRYPSRLERRSTAHGTCFMCEFDFSSFYDAFPLAPALKSYYVMRCRDEHGHDILYSCAKMPMGVRYACSVAQYCTWVLCWPIRKFASTNIDNVRITASNAQDFVSSVNLFLSRADTANLTINDRESWRISDSEILARGHVGHIGPTVFLGEMYASGRVQNTPKNVQKLHDALKLLQSSETTTRRRYASFMGLLIFMANTINQGLQNFYALFQHYSRICTPSSTIYNDVAWDVPLRVPDRILQHAAQAAHIIGENPAVPLLPLLPPGRRNSDYDCVVIVDASLSGWGAYVLVNNEIHELRCGFMEEMKHSAQSEPLAAKRALQYVFDTFGHLANIAVASDHRALSLAQRRFNSGHAGFSTSFYLNDFFYNFYLNVDLAVHRRDVFFVPGTANPADAPSRSVRTREPLSAKVVDVTFPDVSGFDHPFRNAGVRESWMI